MIDYEEEFKKVFSDSALGVSERELLCILDRDNCINFPKNRFLFVGDHRGFRPGKRHMIMGTTGAGKSSLARASMIDCAKTNSVFLYSSEESKEDLNIFLQENAQISRAVLKNITILHEQEAMGICRDVKSFVALLKKRLVYSGAKILFFDNITTSFFYEGQDYSSKIEVFEMISVLIRELNIPVVFIAHTDASTNNVELFDANAIRGPKHPPNKVEFLYAYHRFTVTERQNFATKEVFRAFVRVLKARNSKSNQDKIYSLGFNKETKLYEKDKLISFNDFNDYYNIRLKLGKK